MATMATSFPYTQGQPGQPGPQLPSFFPRPQSQTPSWLMRRRAMQRPAPMAGGDNSSGRVESLESTSPFGGGQPIESPESGTGLNAYAKPSKLLPEQTPAGGQPQANASGTLDPWASNWRTPDPGGTFGIPYRQPTQDQYQMILNNQNSFWDWGNRLDQDLANRQSYYGGLADLYRTGADDAYNPANMQGYTSDQLAQMIRGPEAAGWLQNQDWYNNLQMSPDEAAYWRGDPNSAFQYWNPEEGSNIANNASAQMDARNAEATRGVHGASGQFESTINEAIDPSQLGMSKDYYPWLGKTMAQGRSGVEGAANSGDLGASADYMSGMNWSDADTQRLAEQAGATVGSSYEEQRRRLESNLAGQDSGTSPLSIAAAEADMGRNQAMQAADATTQAYLQGKQLQLNTLQQREGTRLGAAQYQRGLQANTQMGLYDRDVNAGNTAEQMRQGTQQYITGARIGAGNQLANLRTSGELALNSQAQNAYNAGANLQMGAWNANTGYGTGLAQYVDNAASQRAAQMTQNRQQTALTGQQQRNTQGMNYTNYMSQGNTNAANLQQQLQQERRGYLTGQQNTYLGQGSTAAGQRIGAYGTSTGAINTATGQSANYDLGRRQSTSQRIGAIGGVVTGGINSLANLIKAGGGGGGGG